MTFPTRWRIAVAGGVLAVWALVLVACGSDTTVTPSASATVEGGSPSTSSGGGERQESFLDRLVASGSANHLDVKHVPGGATCVARAVRTDTHRDFSGPDLRTARRSPANDGTFTWQWDGDLIQLPSSSAGASATAQPPLEVPVQLRATCTISGQSRTLTLDLTVSP